MTASNYHKLIRNYMYDSYSAMFREEGAVFRYPFLTPGSVYADVLWDWDSWLSNVALRQILAEVGDEQALRQAGRYEKGCVLNFLEWCQEGWIPIYVGRNHDLKSVKPKDVFKENMHKPVLAQHAAFLCKQDGGNAEWLRTKYQRLSAFINMYRNHHRHRTGLYYWQTDNAIGVDNDPCTYFRPHGSSGSIFLNCLMKKELEAMAYISECLQLDEVAMHYHQDAGSLTAAVQEHCWDERDGFYYSVDLNLLPNEGVTGLHKGQPRDWDCLIQRIGVWSGFMAMWAGIATPEQAERMVREHYRDARTFNAPFGVRTLSKLEKMYNLRASGNPSSWLGPIWGISNYMTFRGLLNYGFEKDARDLAEKTVHLFGRDVERFGAMHEYYQPEDGEPILNRGFQNWNFLVLNMINWLEGKEAVVEY